MSAQWRDRYPEALSELEDAERSARVLAVSFLIGLYFVVGIGVGWLLRGLVP